MTEGFIYMTVSNRHKTRCRYIGINNWKRLARPATLQTSLLGKEQLRCLSEAIMFRSNGIRLIAWILLMIIKDDVVHGQTGPNAVALVKGETKLDCTVSLLSSSQWTYTTDGSSNPSSIASGCSVIGDKAYYRTEQPGGNICRLIIANATMQLAGVYTCFDGASTSYRSLVTVIDPVASVVVYNRSEVVVDDQLNISCSINYNGPTSPAPSLRPVPYWTTSPEQIFAAATYHPSTNVATLVANVKVQKPTIPIFKCNTVFEVIGNTTGYNPIPPPDNLTVGVTPPIDVQYSPSIPNITSGYQIITIDGIACEVSNVTCTSSGNPSPVYEWFDTLENVSLIRSSNFDLAEINRNYTCVASNTIRNEMLSSIIFHVPKNGSTTKTCRFPRHESTWINVTGIDDGTGDCSKGYDGLNFTCNADTFPNASYQWTGADGSKVYSKVYKNITINGIYSCTAYFNQSTSNYTGTDMFTNGTSEENVTECSNMPSTTTSTPSANANGEGNEGMYVAVVISVYEIANLISMGFFLAYYNMKTDENKNGNNSNIGALNKKALNDRFPWLEKMLPCMNPSHANAGKKCLGIFLFTLITISCGVFIFPILIIVIKKPCCGEDLHESQENSTLNLRLDDISGNFSGENRFPPQPSSLPPAPPSSHVGLVHRQASSSAGPPRPPPPPNKPTPSAVQHPLRLPPPLLRPPAMNEPINRDGAMEYAFLPFAMKPNLAPVQYLDEESHYAVLRRV